LQIVCFKHNPGPYNRFICGLRNYRKSKTQKIKDFVSKRLFNEGILLSKGLSYPKVSIVTPSYNQSKFIEENILSIQNQDYPYIEHIIADGGSTDGTLDILKKYNDKIIWISEPDNGQTEAINKGFKMANGEICAYLNSDDLYLPGVIKKIVIYFNKHPQVDMIIGDMHYVDETGGIKKTSFFPPFNEGRMIRSGGSLISQTGVFFRRKLFDSIGMFDETLDYAMDYDFYIRAGMKHKVRRIPLIVAKFREHACAKSSSQANEMLIESHMVQKRYMKEDDRFYHIKRFFDRLILFCFKLLTMLRTLLVNKKW